MKASDFKVSEIVAATALLSLAGVGLSLLYDTTYVNELGLQLSSLPYCSEDLTRCIGYWVIILLAGLLFGFFFMATDAAVEQDMLKLEAAKRDRQKLLLKVFYKVNVSIMVVIVTFMLVLSYTGTIKMDAHNNARAYLWLMLWLTVGGELLFTGVRFVRYPRILILVAFFAVSIAFNVVGMAISSVRIDLNKPFSDQVVLSDGDKIDCRIFRRFSNFYLIQLSNDKKFRVIPEREVKYTIQNPMDGAWFLGAKWP